MKLLEYPSAIKDCDKCIELDPSFVKAYIRKGNCLFYQHKFEDAIKVYDKGLVHNPDNADLMQGIERCIMKMQSGATNLSNTDEFGNQLTREQIAERALQDPEIAEIMGDPVMRKILQDMSQDPEAAAEHLKNPLIAEKVKKLVSAGVLQVGRA
eukprot:TRINITY_DN4121_c0_g1_i3.p1 TRINITY_DN4121_c0_g1~~TRINITY_DN4121_c0_g1_i3.p1  ORF type:complete len:154 (-),score=50.25 TRINITY_DN4121_c0_g1_i3:30-491(-)